MANLYKKLSEDEKEKIKLESKNIMDSFGKKLLNVKKMPEEGGIQRKESFREENLKFECDSQFRQRILDNAPKKNKDFIIAEKKSW